MIKKLTQKTEHTNQLGDKGKKEQQITSVFFVNICSTSLQRSTSACLRKVIKSIHSLAYKEQRLYNGLRYTGRPWLYLASILAQCNVLHAAPILLIACSFKRLNDLAWFLLRRSSVVAERPRNAPCCWKIIVLSHSRSLNVVRNYTVE